jgi:hypothetical protein
LGEVGGLGVSKISGSHTTQGHELDIVKIQTGARKLPIPNGSLTHVTASNLCAPCKTPMSPAAAMTKGMVPANIHKLHRASAVRTSGMLSTLETSQGVRTAISRPAAIPSIHIKRIPPDTSSRISPWRGVSQRSATIFVSARPMPKSNRLKYPTSAHTIDINPNRSVPNPSTSRGMAQRAATIGPAMPRKFQAALVERRAR